MNPDYLARVEKFRAMHRRAQRAEGLADKWRRVCAAWIVKSADARRLESRLATLVVDLAESLAEAGVDPLVGSDNPHEDTLGHAVALVPAARLAVQRILDQRADPEDGPFSITLDRMSEETPVDLEGES